VSSRDSFDRPIELPSGTVHRLVADLVRLSVWVEQQGVLTQDRSRRRSLHLTHLSCRLAAEVVHDTILRPPCWRASITHHRPTYLTSASHRQMVPGTEVSKR